MDFEFPVNFYHVLNVSLTATIDEIRTSYKKLAKKYHPDKNPNCGDRFKMISYAHDVLTDPEKLAIYLKCGIEGLKNNRYAKSSMNETCRFQPQNRDILLPYEVTLEEMYAGKFGRVIVNRYVICFRCQGTGKEPRVPPRFSRENYDCEHTTYHFEKKEEPDGTSHDYERNYKNCKNSEEPGVKQPSMSHDYDYEHIPYFWRRDSWFAYSPDGRITRDGVPFFSHGMGFENVCTNCDGKTVCNAPKVLDFQIEAGMRDKDETVFPGEGHQAVGEQPGSLVVILKEAPHEVFHRIADDLFVEKEITQAQALQGFSFELTHLNGEVHIYKQPPGVCNTEPDHVEYFENEGMPLRNETKKGHLCIKFKKLSLPRS